jgi:hypothetical protein
MSVEALLTAMFNGVIVSEPRIKCEQTLCGEISETVFRGADLKS